MDRFTKILILVLRVSFSLRVINHLTILIERSKLSWRIVEIAHKRDLQFGWNSHNNRVGGEVAQQRQ